jgi:AcrR family transcriptional regulator
LNDSADQLTRRQRQGIESREQILDAAERLMATRGVTGTSMSALTKACGLAPSSIYWHFGSKDGVVLAVMERGAQRFFDGLAPAESFRVSGADRVRAQLADTARALEARGDFLHVLLTLLLLRQEGNSAADEVLARVRREARQRVEAMIVDAYGAEDPRTARRRARQLANFVLATIDGAFIAHRGERDVDLQAVIEQLSRAIDALMRSSSTD